MSGSSALDLSTANQRTQWDSFSETRIDGGNLQAHSPVPPTEKTQGETGRGRGWRCQFRDLRDKRPYLDANLNTLSKESIFHEFIEICVLCGHSTVLSNYC